MISPQEIEDALEALAEAADDWTNAFNVVAGAVDVPAWVPAKKPLAPDELIRRLTDRVRAAVYRAGAA